MKYDEKTGKAIPENRSDEVSITLQNINEIHKKTNGMNDKMNDVCQLLADISVSLGLLVDVVAMMYNIYNKTVKTEDDTASETSEEDDKE